MAKLTVLTTIADATQLDGQYSTKVRSRIAGESVATGKVVYDDPTTGKMKVADAATSATTAQAYGLSVEGTTKGAGQAVSIMSEGIVAGYDLSGLNFGAKVYLDTTGDLADAANGTRTVCVGRVVGNGTLDSSGNVQKFVELFFNPVTTYS